jgi:hypothetical protein
MTNNLLIVTIVHPEDLDRDRDETYGPFADEADRDQWVKDCEEAAADGWDLLKGVHYHLQSLATPFDPTSLWELRA